jgi:hypothetical protein
LSIKAEENDYSLEKDKKVIWPSALQPGRSSRKRKR